jgi:hypothetical protein
MLDAVTRAVEQDTLLLLLFAELLAESVQKNWLVEQVMLLVSMAHCHRHQMEYQEFRYRDFESGVSVEVRSCHVQSLFPLLMQLPPLHFDQNCVQS